MIARPHSSYSFLTAAAIIAAATAVACGGGSEGRSLPDACDTGICLGESVELTVTVVSDFPEFPPRPHPSARIGAFPGEEVTALIHGFDPDSEATLLSTNQLYNRTPVRVGPDGIAEVVLSMSGGPETQEQHFVLYQPGDEAEVRIAIFVVVVLDGSGLTDILGEALPGS